MGGECVSRGVELCIIATLIHETGKARKNTSRAASNCYKRRNKSNITYTG